MSAYSQWLVENICSRISELDATSRQQVFERVEAMKNEDGKNGNSPPEPKAERRLCVYDLRGSGAGLWSEGADEFIRKERESWEEREAAWSS